MSDADTPTTDSSGQWCLVHNIHQDDPAHQYSARVCEGHHRDATPAEESTLGQPRPDAPVGDGVRLRCEARTPVPIRCWLNAGHDGHHKWWEKAPVDDGKDRASDDSDALLVEQIARLIMQMPPHPQWSPTTDLAGLIARALVVARPW